MGKRKLQIKNKSVWATDSLRAFFVTAANEQGFDGFLTVHVRSKGEKGLVVRPAVAQAWLAIPAKPRVHTRAVETMEWYARYIIARTAGATKTGARATASAKAVPRPMGLDLYKRTVKSKVKKPSKDPLVRLDESIASTEKRLLSLQKRRAKLAKKRKLSELAIERWAKKKAEDEAHLQRVKEKVQAIRTNESTSAENSS